MNKYIFKDLPEEARMEALQDHADSIENHSFSKRLSEDDLNLFRKQFAELSIQLQNKEAEMKEVASNFKEEIKKLKKEAEPLLESIKGKFIHKTEKCFVIYDHEAKTVGYYDSTGELVDQRRINPNEQMNIFKINRKAQ